MRGRIREERGRPRTAFRGELKQKVKGQGAGYRSYDKSMADEQQPSSNANFRLFLTLNVVAAPI